MPRLPKSPPKYRHHKATGQAVVTIDGKDFYLGPWRSKASRCEYDRLIGEWMQNGRSLPRNSACDTTVVEVFSAYLKFAGTYYVKNGEPTREVGLVKDVSRFVVPLYGRTAATEFGPLALKSVRQRMIEAGHGRRNINKNVDRIRRAFKWAAAEEMIPPSVPQALAMVPGLRQGRSEARETAPVQPVADDIVELTIDHLPDVVADMVRFQRLTGCRPGEVCILRPRDVERSGGVWRFRPESHKTEHFGRPRVILIGPKAQAILRPYLLRSETAYCFSPQDSEKSRRAAAHDQRTTPLSCGNRPGTNRKRKPRRAPRDQYTNDSYRRAIHRACGRAGIDRWSPNRLRHSAATEIREKYGLEAAQTVLGHASADITQVYAERDLALAAKVMEEVG
ncbi:MAG: tyrosine-type recombinase/integrase [Pirellulales bacterium]